MTMTIPSLDPQSLIVILTGAGISKESGLDTFRCAGGIWAQYDLEDVATPQGFLRNPQLVHGFYNGRRAGLLDKEIQPNAAHKALAHLEQAWPGGVLLVTQNIDDLHERGGSQNIIHMHGELLKIRCEHCHTITEWREDLGLETVCGACQRKGGMRPHVVWFGEMPLQMAEIGEALQKCGLFLSIGTSGHVYPAAGFVSDVQQRGHGHCIEMNLEPTAGQSLFDDHIYGLASEVVPDFVQKLLATLPQACA